MDVTTDAGASVAGGRVSARSGPGQVRREPAQRRLHGGGSAGGADRGASSSGAARREAQVVEGRIGPAGSGEPAGDPGRSRCRS